MPSEFNPADTAPHSFDLSFDAHDEVINPKPADCDFDGVVEGALSRRGFLNGVLTFGGISMLAGMDVGLASGQAQAASSRFQFDAVAANTLDTITVPASFQWQVLVRWGDPLWSDGKEFDRDSLTAATQMRGFGDNNDGMDLFADGNRQILVANNEYTNRRIMYGNRLSQAPETVDDVHKGKAAHGISVMEVRQRGNTWSVVQDSPYNRRITADSDMEITGPAAGHDLLKTAADPSGTRSLGTWSNCGNGRTPWGTYLACEENFNSYFSSSDPQFIIPDALKRYSIAHNDWGYGWASFDERFDISRHPNEPNRAGYVVEIDPLDANSVPKKRTALGRIKHENAEVVVNSDGRVIVYMGDDEPGEFLYKYISDGVYVEGGETGHLLSSGTLYAARFDEDGSGRWLALTPETTGMKDRGEIAVHTRLAGSKVGATTMDRPEWVATNPAKAELYCALTKNKKRGIEPNKGGDAMPVGGPNPRQANKYGQIVRWRPQGGDHSADRFDWDLFVLAGNPEVHSDARAGSKNINAGNMFNAPDGITFDDNGLLWIRTDGKYSNKMDFAGQGNNQMLVGDPITGEIRRFMVGPNECEISGLCWSGDRKTMFVGIQHPGEKGGSHFPDGGNSVPRSAIIAVRRNDGGRIG